MKPRVWLPTWYCLLPLTAFGCTHGNDGAAPGAPVVAFVAASTKDAVQEIASTFKKKTKVGVKVNADDSSKLALQIVQEAPAHLFLSANEKWADYVQDKGFAHETQLLLGNSLVIVTPTGNPADIHDVGDLTGKALQRLAVAGPTVPAGIYARQALKNLKLWDSLAADKKVIPGENVRVALTYVERGEAEAGIVYGTDARISGKVEVVYTFPADTHEPIRYPLVLLKGGAASAPARSFFEYLQSPPAQQIFARHGFSLLDKK